MFLISNNTQIKQIAKFLDSKFKTEFGLGASASGALVPPKFGGTETEKKQNFQARAKTQTKQNKCKAERSKKRRNNPKSCYYDRETKKIIVLFYIEKW